MNYNIYYSGNCPTTSLFDIAEGDLSLFINAYKKGLSSVTLAGIKYGFNDITEFRIFYNESDWNADTLPERCKQLNLFRKSYFSEYVEPKNLLRFGAEVTKEKIENYEYGYEIDQSFKPTKANDTIYKALIGISQPLSNSYEQIINDLNDDKRISWVGTAHEIREIITNLLRILAPDHDVSQESWYKPEKESKGPTQKQRVRYILQKQVAGSKQSDVVQLVGNLENLIADLVRATYSRASDAAHRSKTKTEVERIFNYFNAFIHDLLDLK